MNNELESGIVKAQYTKTDEKRFLGNPFYEALKTDEELLAELDLLRDMPFIDDEIREKSSNKEKLSLLDDVEDGFFLLLHYYNTFEKINRLIKRGYLNRNPMTKEYVEELNRLARELQTGIFSDTPATLSTGIQYAENGSKIMAIFGVAGSGKSTAARVELKLHPKAILHENYNGTHFNALQIPCVQIKCPSECSLQSICCDFFDAIDKVAGTNYRARFGGTTKDVSIMVNRMRSLGALYGIGLFVVDELQDLVDSKQDTSTVKTFISQLANKAGFPILLIGTIKAKELFTSGSSMRRIVSGGEDVWDLMLEGDDEWNHVIGQLWKARVLNDKRDIMPDDINKALFAASQGNLFYLKTIYLDAQRLAIEADEEVFTVELISDALKDNPTICKIVTAISEKDVSILAELGDVVIDNTHYMNAYKKNYEYREKIDSLTKTLIENRELRSKDRLSSVVACIREAEIARNLTEEELETIVEKVLRKHQEASPEIILLSAIEAAKLESESRKPKKRRKMKDDVVEKKEGESIYDSLAKTGYVAEAL
ncbi:MAG TPA: ATP-binding protein [Patescibacteria group bacterium]|nr:ATP-binding protein [Patescibacteria group bacterium]